MNKVRETRTVILWGLFLILVPLFFYPYSQKWQLPVSWITVLIFEMIFYFAVWFFTNPGNWGRSLANTFWSLCFRFSEATLFGILLWVMFSLNLGLSFKQGFAYFLPAVVLHVLTAPFLLKPLLKPARVIHRPPAEFTKDRLIEVDKIVAEKSDPVFHKEKGWEISESYLEEILGSLTNYPGVDASLLVDQEGLVIAKNCKNNFDWESWAPLPLILELSTCQALSRIREKNIMRMDIFSNSFWISIHKVYSFSLITVSEKSTDEILNVRIEKVCERIKKYLNERYHLENLKVQEEKYVSNTIRA
ncbi:MAG: hypothetical protein A2145_01995 [candidate division Zixibacteria bacterium RBG_16_40_9]|nr:MAG: hypothetical protein A2145_01995 [candidate division Zixibacteria bacterium RBG_16_40_9]